MPRRGRTMPRRPRRENESSWSVIAFNGMGRGIVSGRSRQLARRRHTLDWQARHAVGLGWQFGSVASVEWPAWQGPYVARGMLAPAAETSVSEAEPEARGSGTIPRETVQAPSEARRQRGREVVNGLVMWGRVEWGRGSCGCP